MSLTLLDSYYEDKTIPTEREHRRPSTVFEKNLDDWKRTRGNDLRDKPDGAYQYFIADLKRKMAATAKVSQQAEEARAAIRAGAKLRNVPIDADNAPPGRYLEMTATWFGWRLVPLVRKYAKELGQPGFAALVQGDVLSWLAKADALWEALETMPGNATARESFAVWVEPLRADAERICNAVYDWIDINT